MRRASFLLFFIVFTLAFPFRLFFMMVTSDYFRTSEAMRGELRILEKELTGL